jgi:hypothetical protein
MLVTRPEPTRIAVCRYDNRDSSRHPLGCERSRCSLGHDQVNFRAHEFRASRAVRGRLFCHSSRTTICRTHSFEIPTASPIAPSVVPAFRALAIALSRPTPRAISCCDLGITVLSTRVRSFARAAAGKRCAGIYAVWDVDHCPIAMRLKKPAAVEWPIRGRRYRDSRGAAWPAGEHIETRATFLGKLERRFEPHRKPGKRLPRPQRPLENPGSC